MKKSPFAVASLFIVLFLGCSADHKVQPDSQLLSSSGFKISDSFEDFEKAAHLLMEDKNGTDTAITITKVDYKKLPSSPESSFAATVYYKTATGQRGHFEVDGGRSESAN